MGCFQPIFLYVQRRVGREQCFVGSASRNSQLFFVICPQQLISLRRILKMILLTERLSCFPK